MRALAGLMLCVLSAACAPATRADVKVEQRAPASCGGRPFFDCIAGVAAGGARTCAWSTGGDGLCWGGQLGGHEDHRFTDVVDMRATRGVVCALDARGMVTCAGHRFERAENPDGSRAIAGPFEAPGLRPLRLDVHDDELCVLGADEQGVQLVLGSAQLRFDPRQVDHLAPGEPNDCLWTSATRDLATDEAFSELAHAPLVQVERGWAHSCALDQDGAVYCWGHNEAGALGRGTLSAHERAARVPGLPAVIGIAVGDVHSCARTATGALYCWGDNARGQLGAQRPVVATRAKAVGRAVGGVRAERPELGYCVAGPAGAACTDAKHALPVALPALDGASFAAADENGLAWVDLLGTAHGLRGPQRDALFVSSAAEILKGWNDTWVLASDGRVTGWGDVSFVFHDDVEHPIPIARTEPPRRFDNLRGIAKISSAMGCALMRDGGVRRIQRHCDEPSSCPRLLPLPEIKDAIDVAGGSKACFVVTKSGTTFVVEAPGALPPKDPRPLVARRFAGFDDARAIDADDENVCVLTRDGRARCGSTVDLRRGLRLVPGAEGLVSLAVVSAGACGRRADDAVLCWALERGYVYGVPHDPAADAFATPIRVGAEIMIRN